MKSKAKRIQNPEQWHYWYAWRPVHVKVAEANDNSYCWVWREKVLRKRVYMTRGFWIYETIVQ